MDEIVNNWIRKVDQSIYNVFATYSDNKGNILTEGDLECHMFNSLITDKSLGQFQKTRSEGYNSCSVHSQVTWFNQIRRSGYEVDLTIIDPTYLSPREIEMQESFPSKNYYYDGPCIAIELKFVRHKFDSKAKIVEDYIHIMDLVRKDKHRNIEKGRYKRSTKENVAFISIIGFKEHDYLDHSYESLIEEIQSAERRIPLDLEIYIMSPLVLKKYNHNSGNFETLLNPVLNDQIKLDLK